MQNQFEPLQPKESEAIKILKATAYLILSLVKGAVSGLALLIWLTLGLVFVSNALSQFTPIKDVVLSSSPFIFLLLLIYETIYNFKRIKHGNN